MKNKNLFFKIYISLLIVFILVFSILSILGKKNRVGYLGEFDFYGDYEEYIDKTLELNGLTNIKENYMLDGKLDKEAIKNFILTNDAITNYSYGFRIKYYDKVFRNSDIYGVYIDTNKLLEDNSFVKEIVMGEDGSPFGNLISTKIINEDKIDNVIYYLKIKFNIIYNFFWIIIFPFIFYLLMKYLKNRISSKKLDNINIFLHSNSKKYSFVIALIFFVLMFFSEIKLFYAETGKEFFYKPSDPRYFLQTSLYLNPFFLENTNSYSNRIDMNVERRNIKSKYNIYSDQFTDNHIMGNIYAALKTGKTLYELRSHNFVSPKGLLIKNNLEFASEEDFNTPTLYSSTPLFVTKIIYSLIPKDLRYIDTYEKELKASYYIYKIKTLFIFVHILLWALLIYVIGIKFNIFYSFIISIITFSFPGSSIIMPIAYLSVNLIPIFPLYIFIFYNNNLGKIKLILFYIGLALLIFMQWSLAHFHSVAFQLPFILILLAFYNFYFQMKNRKLNNVNDVIKIIFNHIKRYSLQYLLIILYTALITFLVILLSYKEMIKLQPENKDIIHYKIFERSTDSASRMSLFLLGDGRSDNIEEYYITYSIENFIRHNILIIQGYFSYPVVYPLWKLDYLLPNFITNFIYKVVLYIPLYIIVYLYLILSIFILLEHNDMKQYVIIPFLFFMCIIFWFFIFSNFLPRVASHVFLYVHMLDQYFVVILISIIIYLLLIIFLNKKDTADTL